MHDSSAGAGSIFEALRSSKQLLVVINTDLMDNHQLELAAAMGEFGYLQWCDDVDQVAATLERMTDQPACKALPPPALDKFRAVLDKTVGR